MSLSGALISIGISRPNQNINTGWEMLSEYKDMLETMSENTKNCVKKTICLLSERPEFAKEIEQIGNLIRTKDDQTASINNSLMATVSDDIIAEVFDVENCRDDMDCDIKETDPH